MHFFIFEGIMKGKKPKTISVRRFTVKEIYLVSAVSEIFRYRQKKLNTLCNRVSYYLLIYLLFSYYKYRTIYLYIK